VAGPTWRVMPATLTGADLVWGPDENIRISSHDTTIPGGSTLTINPGTLIMVDTTGSVENGTLITVNGQVVGSELIGQPFARAEYFHPRPSAAGNGYDDTLSAGTNKGPTDLKLADTLVAQAVDSAVRLDGAVKGSVPADLATRSGSGLDPHISPASAFLQVNRVARARGLDTAVVRGLVDRHIEGRTFGLLGDPRVNVLMLNLALDSLARSPQ